MWTAAILAGGRAERLGGTDKSALVVDGASILDRQLAALAELTPCVFAVANGAPPWREPRVPIVQDRILGAGALGGIYTALMEATTEQVLVLACDMPFVTAPFLSYLVTLGLTVDAAVPRDTAGRHPLCASYSRRIAWKLEERIRRGQLRVGDALEDLNVLDVGPDVLESFDPEGRLLTNINTPDDYARACVAVGPRTPTA